MRISWSKAKYVNLHDQMHLFSSRFALSGKIEKRSLTVLGWRWRKRAAILTDNGQLYIFKYFLEGKGAAEPYMGHIIHVDTSPFVVVKLQNDTTYIKIIDDNNIEIQFRVRGNDAYLWAAKMFTWQLEVKEIKPLLENTSSNEPLKEPSNWSLATAWSLSSNDSYKTESSPINAIAEDTSAEGTNTISPMESTQLISDASLPLHVDSISKSERTNDRKEFKIATSEITYSSRRGSSISSSYGTSTISQTRTRSLSADDVNTIIPIRRQRFRQQLKNLIESGIYNSLTDCTRDAPYSAATIREINAYARDLRLSSVYAPSVRNAYEDATYGINTYGAQKQLPLCGPSLPLSITLTKKPTNTD